MTIALNTPRRVIDQIDRIEVLKYFHDEAIGDWQIWIALYAGTVRFSIEKTFVRKGVDNNGTSRDHIGRLRLNQQATTIQERVTIETMQVDDAYSIFVAATEGAGSLKTLIETALDAAGVFPIPVTVS